MEVDELRLRAALHLEKALMFAQRGDLETAISELQAVLEFDKDYAEAHYYLGACLLAAGRAVEALKEFDEALKLDDSYFEAHVRKGIALRKLHEEGICDFNAAIEEFKKAIRKNPKCVEARYNLAIALLERGDVAAAKSELAEILKIDPECEEAKELRRLLDY
ncbi:MAG: hypothetical protein OD814_001090 [Candidatus Alkanophagales archaeon MCA70_species_1]|nr:hypothetical protein [Candidatus Alkanophaga volatiphilum]